MRPVVLDCDGVLLDWLAPFARFAALHTGRKVSTPYPSEHNLRQWIGTTQAECDELVTKFNQSAEFGKLLPLPGAIKAVKALRTHGHPLYVLTACGTESAEARRGNVQQFFGLDVVVRCLSLGAEKFEALRSFEPGIFVEDNDNHAFQGALAGHESFCFCRPYNVAEQFDVQGVTWVTDWGPIVQASARMAARTRATTACN